MTLSLRPCDWATAQAFINAVHRHHRAPQGWKYGLSAWQEGAMIGVATIGRPVARMIADPLCLEVTRLATDGTKNACSFLYGAAARSASELGYTRLITYTLESESGTSLLAAGWICAGPTKGGTWSRPSRLRLDEQPTCPKLLWEAF